MSTHRAELDIHGSSYHSCFHGPSRSAGESSCKCWSQRELWQCRHRQRPRPSSSGTKSSRAGQGRAGVSGHLPLNFPSSQKPPWCPGVLQGMMVTASIAVVPHHTSRAALYNLSQGIQLQLSSDPLLQPLSLSGFSSRTNTEEALPAQLHPLVPRGTLPSPWPHPAQDTRISAMCKTLW